jgi:hypothetical protein
LNAFGLAIPPFFVRSSTRKITFQWLFACCLIL